MTVTTISGAANSMGISNTDAVYATAHDAASGDLLRSNPIYFGQSAGIMIERLAGIFDCSVIPPSAVITAANFQINLEQDSSFTDFDFTIQYCTPPYPHIPVVLGDYDYNQYSGNGGILSTFGIGMGYQNVPFNATGLTWINKGGTTKLMLRSSRDIASLWSGGNEYVRITGPAGANPPRLEITWSPGRYNPCLRRQLVEPLKIIPLG